MEKKTQERTLTSGDEVLNLVGVSLRILKAPKEEWNTLRDYVILLILLMISKIIII
jgi:hypothetical protein